jgi:hypothetical protein
MRILLDMESQSYISNHTEEILKCLIPFLDIAEFQSRFEAEVILFMHP